MSNDELQKAIDDITGGGSSSEPKAPDLGDITNATSGVELGGEAAAPIESTLTGGGDAKIDLGTAPTPEVPSEFSMPTIGGEGEKTGGAELGNSPTSAPEAQGGVLGADLGSTAGSVENSVSGALKAEISGDDVEKVKDDAKVELYPLLDKVNLDAKRKFEICVEVVEKIGDKGALSAALQAAKEIADPTEKANALLKIIEL